MMHVNTATNCRSQYTIDRNTGEKLVCALPVERHGRAGFSGLVHIARYQGTEFYWTDEEEDK